jgi:hypothetical protein
MATFVLIPGAGSDSWYWHLVEPELRKRGYDVVSMDLPCDDDGAGLAELPGGHLPALAHPLELAEHLDAYWARLESGVTR